MFPLYKDLDRFIISKLSDKDILSVSVINKYFYTICNNDFFRKIVKERYPTVLYEDKRTLVNILYCIERMNSMFQYRYKFGNPITQLGLFHKYGWFDYDLLLIESANAGELALVQETFNSEIWPSDHIYFQIALSYAANNIEIVKYLVSTAKDNEESNHYHYSNFIGGFERACWIGNVEVVEYLIEHNAMLDSGYNTPIKNAAVNGHLSIVKILLEKGVDIIDFEHLFQTVSTNEHKDIVEYIRNNYRKNN